MQTTLQLARWTRHDCCGTLDVFDIKPIAVRCASVLLFLLQVSSFPILLPHIFPSFLGPDTIVISRSREIHRFPLLTHRLSDPYILLIPYTNSTPFTLCEALEDSPCHDPKSQFSDIEQAPRRSREASAAPARPSHGQAPISKAVSYTHLTLPTIYSV